ncbi:hypothetical protein AAG906_033328 [Vitis piasezkii]
MVGALKEDNYLVHLQGFYKNMALRNQTLKDMVRSMVSNSNLSLSLWSEAIKTTTYVLNRVPTKAVPKTPFELWKCWKPSLRHNLECKVLENDVISESNESRHLVFEEFHNIEPALESSSGLIIFPDSHQDLTIQETPIVNEPHHEDIMVDSIIQHSQQGNVDITLRRSTRERKSAIFSDYVVYLQEYDIDSGMNSMANNQVWDLVELPKCAKVIDSLGNIEIYKARLVAKGFTQQE